MDAAKESSFGTLLRQCRLAAGLSQEQLADRAGMSVRGISDLERGIHRAPYRQTLTLLLDALEVDREQRAAMTAAARRPTKTASSPVRPSAAVPHNLPAEANSFIGRARDLATLQDLLRQPEVRLVTLTGPGGSGKTRLALRAGANVLGEFADGVFLVSLAAVTDPQVVPAAIAAALGLLEEGHGPIDAVRDYLNGRNVLLVLDNFEHLLTAARLLPELLEHCPRLRLLVTSRAVLRLSWEYVFEVQPLALPDPAHDDDNQALSRYEAVALFIERARAADAAFAVTRENGRSVAEICRRLDGLPLAIELAAARLRLLPPQVLLGRLNSRLTLLTGGARDRPTRQQTLRATIDWSYSLLDDAEQKLFARLAVFAGGCTTEAAEAVCDVAGDLTAEVPDGTASVLDGAASLIDKSLLRRRDPVGYPEPASYPESVGYPEPHLGMLETIREYASERLEESSDAEIVRQQHAAYYLSLAEKAAIELTGPHRGHWLNRLEEEHDNLRAALRWTEEHRQVRTGLRLTVALSRFWESRGYTSEGARWLAGLLAVAREEAPELRAAALKIAGSLAFASNFASAAALSEQSLVLYRALGDGRGTAEALLQCGIIAVYQADYQRAAEFLGESSALAQALGDANLVNRSLWSLAWPDTAQGNISETKKLAEKSLELSRQLQDPSGAGAALEALLYVARLEGDLGRVWSLLEETMTLLRHADLHPDTDLRERLERMAFEMTTFGAYEQAMTLMEEGIDLSLRKGDRRDAAYLGAALGQFARERGRFERAESVLEESLAAFRELEDAQGTAIALIGLGDVARDQGDSKRAVVLSQEGLTLARECTDFLLAGYALHNLGVAAWQQGDLAQAESLLAAALASFDPAAEGAAEVLASNGLLALERGHFPAATRAFADSLRTGRTRDMPWLVAMDMEGLAEVATGQGDAELAARLLGAADAIRAASGTPVQPAHQERYDRGLAAARAALSQKRFSEVYQWGQAMPVEQVINVALASLAG